MSSSAIAPDYVLALGTLQQRLGRIKGLSKRLHLVIEVELQAADSWSRTAAEHIIDEVRTEYPGVRVRVDWRELPP